MLGRRLASAGVIVAALISMIVLDHYLGRDDQWGRPGLILSLIAISVGMMSAYEYSLLLKSSRKSISVYQNVAIAGIGVTICCLPVVFHGKSNDVKIGVLGWTMLALTFTTLATLLLEIKRYNGNRRATLVAGLSCMILNLIIILFGFFVGHRLLQKDNSVGMVALITLIASVKMSDAAAYFFGKSFGRNKLASMLSPGKTVEGFFGGVVGALAGSLIVLYLIAPFVFGLSLENSLVWVIIYSLAVTFAGVVGDLSESMLKRDAKMKDSSSWLPGLGGVLDVTDSLVFAAPVSFLFWTLVS